MDAQDWVWVALVVATATVFSREVCADPIGEELFHNYHSDWSVAYGSEHQGLWAGATVETCELVAPGGHEECNKMVIPVGVERRTYKTEPSCRMDGTVFINTMIFRSGSFLWNRTEITCKRILI